MKILLMTDSFLPHAGGSRVYYHNLYRRITTGSSECVVVLTKKVPGWKEFDAQVSTPSFRIVRRFEPLPNYKPRQLPKGFLTLFEGLRLLATERPDIIHAGDLFPPGLSALAIKKMLGMPYVVYCHGEEITQIDFRRHQPKVRNQIYRHADGIVAASTFAQQNLLRIGISPDRIRQITPGVDCERFQPRPKNAELVRQYGLEGKQVLLTVARLVRRKGHAIVLEAVARLAPKMRDLRYLIVGEGPEREQLERQCRDLGIAENVIFAGHTPDELLVDFYNLCDAFIMINRESRGDIEGFGMVFLEANAAGRPVIGGLSGGAAQAVVQDVTGLLVNPDSPEEAAAAIEQLMTNQPMRRRMSETGLRRARQEFSWDSRSDALREFNLEVLDRVKSEKRARHTAKSAAAI
jgi:phosphatidylinositol alpha-1,6-mannosyltransferase